ncbi:MAG: hypothetical protein RLZ98_848 [Pseudomonadota bacterium]|jgi:N-methylhydantoinase A
MAPGDVRPRAGTRDCRLAVDIGGTFTDVVLEMPDGTLSGKVLTTPDAPEEAVLSGVERVLGEAGVGPERVAMVMHGTTLATNAIIERRGARTALLTTEGFRDTLELAYGSRFDQYDLELTRPEPLIRRPLRIDVAERLAADGSVLKPLDEAMVRKIAADLRAKAIQSVAVCFLHSYVNGAHEARVGEILKQEMPDVFVSLSHEVCPEIREYERTATTVGNAYVQPLMSRYLGLLENTLNGYGIDAPLLLITSAGALTSVETAVRFPIRLVESGPAGGAILGQHIAKELGARQSVALDMGGTTAKIVLLNDFEARHSRSMEVARAHRFMPGSGIPLRIPVIDLIEIGAGGGSIAWLDELSRITVGPESAGSKPGPVCYGLGGERATVTDADLVLGKIDSDDFAGGRMKLDSAGAEQTIGRDIGAPLGIGGIEAAAGIAEIVDENMANATRVHAADNGDRLETRVLIATGGAAPLHAARIAQKLGIDAIVIPKGAGVGSAYGFLKAPVAYEAVRSQVISLEDFDAEQVNAIYRELRREAEGVLELASGSGHFAERRFADMRYRGQGHDLAVEIPARDYETGDGRVLEGLFHETYAKNFNRTIPNLRAQALTWTLVLYEEREVQARAAPEIAGDVHEAKPKGRRGIFDAGLGRTVEARVFQREAMRPGATFAGPAVVTEEQTTTYVPPGYAGHMSAGGHLVIERRGRA